MHPIGNVLFRIVSCSFRFFTVTEIVSAPSTEVHRRCSPERNAWIVRRHPENAPKTSAGSRSALFRTTRRLARQRHPKSRPLRVETGDYYSTRRRTGLSKFSFPTRPERRLFRTGKRTSSVRRIFRLNVRDRFPRNAQTRNVFARNESVSRTGLSLGRTWRLMRENAAGFLFFLHDVKCVAPHEIARFETYRRRGRRRREPVLIRNRILRRIRAVEQ